MLNTSKKSQDLYKNRPWLTFLVLVTLGTMVLAVCSLLLGCGSDRKPDMLSTKKEKTTAGAKVMKTPVALSLRNQGVVGQRTLKREPLSPDTELVPGLTVRQVEERGAAALKRIQSPDYEILPGMTRQQLDDKIALATQNAQKELESPNREVLPGMTKQQLDDKIASARQNAQKELESPNREVLPGMTKQQLEAKVEAARRKGEAQSHEILPGITKDELKDRVEAERRKSEAQRQ
jgi:hypothetical protein